MTHPAAAASRRQATDIRAARRSDAAAIGALWSALVEAHAALDPVLGLQPGAGPALEREALAAIGAADVGIWVAERDARVVGFACARLERASPLAVETSRVEISEIAVAPAARRAGVGRALAGAALDWARRRGARRVEVRVSARNELGQAFWRSLGFGAFVDVLDRRL